VTETFIPRPFSGPWDTDFRAASVLLADKASFRALLMAAMVQCSNPSERRILAWGFPGVARYLSGRGHAMPLRTDPLPSQGVCLLDLDAEDLAEQLREAMGVTSPAWAPAVIELIRHRHPEEWEDAIRTAKLNDQAKMEM
jgi:hypothetical protein